MAEIRNGTTQKPASARLLRELLEQPEFDGIFYVGYPIFFVAGESVAIDALWISESKGVVLFDLVEGTDLGDRESIRDELYGKMESQLVANPALKNKRNLAVPIEVFTFSPAALTQEVNSQTDTFKDPGELMTKLQGLANWGEEARYKILTAQIQSILKLRGTRSRSYVQKAESRGALIRDFENTIANLDQQQEKAIIESVDSVQRIRGLAGSGKTVILALKAAYLHSINPSWDIAITFHTRSLKQQFRSLIKRFCIEKIGEEPDWNKIRILNAWGSPSNPGVYSEACKEVGEKYLDFGMAKRLGGGDPFDDALTPLLDESITVPEIFDVVLVDEAQDLPVSFLKLCYALLTPQKRLIYAYDEMQTLNEGQALPAPRDIFGVDAHDITLRCCYRNPRPLLVAAHALGLGIYRENDEKVQFFKHAGLWSDVGYSVKEGELVGGENVVLFRPEDTSPGFFEDRVSTDDLLAVHSFDDDAEQSNWVFSQIMKNIQEDELLPSDILVISPDALATKNATSLIRKKLLLEGVANHIAGEVNADVFSKQDSVAFSGIYRAKGNEAAMVYIINSQTCYGSRFNSSGNLIKRRNTLFTAITRSKAWVRICGVGERMEKLRDELQRVRDNEFQLKFRYPTDDEIDHMNVIHRDISQEGVRRIKKSEDVIQFLAQVKESIDCGETFIEDYPADIQKLLGK
ncbi:MAG: DEAD/DEAH box helicase [Spongiibacter marinus]|uniref:DEAD/DEAH box helicase n=1 Tax=Spongiibacter marinus TaxID=354246 RepID=UPI003C4A3814